MTAKLQVELRSREGPLLEVTDLHTHFKTARGLVRSVDGVSFNLDRGAALGIVGEERTIKGSYMGSCVPRRDIPRFIDLYQAGKLPVEKLHTHTLRLDEINAGFDRLAKGEAVRQVIDFSR